MRKLLTLLCLLSMPNPAVMADDGALIYAFEFSVTGSELDKLTLGDDPDADRLVEQEYELEFYIEYLAANQIYYYFGGSLIDETEEEKPNGERDHVSGFERGEMGVGYGFGEIVESEVRVGRREYLSSSDWWYWWDEDLDSISLESRWGPLEGMVALAEEQAPEVTDMDFIDPENDDVRRLLAHFDWQFADGQLLQFYYLDQDDRSSPYVEGQSVREQKIDDSDADLTWKGINYLGWFEHEALGALELQLAWAEVSGEETLYEFDDASAGRADVDEIGRQRVDGEASGVLLRLRPRVLDGVAFVFARARGSGDQNEDDGVDESFRQTGLQGDSEVFGELYQPELSNLVVDTVGIQFNLFDELDVGLFRHDYRQDELAEEMRDVSIDVDTEGGSKSLGHEIDLVLNFDVYDVEVELIAAEFEAGRAYGEFDGDKSRYWKIELSYVF